MNNNIKDNKAQDKYEKEENGNNNNHDNAIESNKSNNDIYYNEEFSSLYHLIYGEYSTLENNTYKK